MSEIDNLVNQLSSSLVIEEEIDEMPPQGEINYQLLRLYVDAIPNYDGNPHTLSIFLDSCENLISTFADTVNLASPINNYLLRAIIGKLTGRALALVGCRTELRAWKDIKEALNLSFSDQRDIDCLVQDLLLLRPLKSESPYNFGMRCQDARCLIISKLNSQNLSKAERDIRLKNYEDLALKTFMRGLTGTIQNNVRLRNPDKLETAMGLVIEEENFLYAQNKQNFQNLQPTFRPVQRITPTRSFNFGVPPKQNQQITRPPFIPQQFNAPRPQFNQNQMQHTTFSWRPNNNFPIQKHPYFLQRPSQVVRSQNFNPRNSTQSRNSNFNRQQQYPQPMDTSSSNSPIARTQPKFTSTELFNQDISNLDYQAEIENYYMINNDGYVHQNPETSYYASDPYNFAENTSNDVAEGQNFYNPYYTGNQSQNPCENQTESSCEEQSDVNFPSDTQSTNPL